MSRCALFIAQAHIYSSSSVRAPSFAQRPARYGLPLSLLGRDLLPLPPCGINLQERQNDSANGRPPAAICGLIRTH